MIGNFSLISGKRGVVPPLNPPGGGQPPPLVFALAKVRRLCSLKNNLLCQEEQNFDHSSKYSNMLKIFLITNKILLKGEKYKIYNIYIVHIKTYRVIVSNSPKRNFSII